MDSYFRLGLLLLAVILIGIIVFDSWARKRRHRAAKLYAVGQDLVEHYQMRKPSSMMHSVEGLPNKNDAVEQSHIRFHKDLLFLYVFAKQGAAFQSYDLLQAISSTGMQYGNMNIFHYYLPDSQKQVSLFSMASATEPGDFDLDNIGELSCNGLVLFMHLSKVPDPMKAFKMMLHKAQQLADDLEGELRANPQTPWSDRLLQSYQDKILQVQSLN